MPIRGGLRHRTTFIIISLFLFFYTVAAIHFGNFAIGNATKDHFLILAFGQEDEQPTSLPQIEHHGLLVEPVIENGLIFPTSMAFLDNDTLLVTQKDDGNVMAIINGTVKNQPVITVQVENRASRGLLGITAIEKPPSSASNHNDFIFLYYTELYGEDQVRNRVYRYEWNEEHQTLVNGTMILDLPADPGPGHNGGKLEADKKGNIYTIIGDLFREGQLQNVVEGPPAEGSSVVIRITENGSAVMDNPFFNEGTEWMQKYYAYGIRNSFGLAIDPISGFLWDTENGPESYDEMNIVYPGFNSGWNQVMGPASRSDMEQVDLQEELMNFEGSTYADPVFSWEDPVGLTDLEFLNSTALGPQYAYNLFVGDINNGNLYFFELDSNRTGINLDSSNMEDLTDQVADNDDEIAQITLGRGFDGGIADIETGPDGYLYVLTFSGSIYRIIPANNGSMQT